MAFQGPPEPALKDGLCGNGLCGGPCEGMGGAGGVWWGVCEWGECWLYVSVVGVECVAEGVGVAGSCVHTRCMDGCLQFVQVTLCGIVGGSCWRWWWLCGVCDVGVDRERWVNEVISGGSEAWPGRWGVFR